MEIKGCYETIEEFILYGLTKAAPAVPYFLGAIFVVVAVLLASCFFSDSGKCVNPKNAQEKKNIKE